MRSEILQLLRQHKEISGEEISRRLGISRAAVAKHINVLRDMGYVIEASPRVGYSFISAPDLLSAAEILPHLAAPVWQIRYEQQVDSTNRRLLIAAEDGADDHTVLIAEAQSAGRGRFSRVWHSEAGQNLLLSLLLRPNLPPHIAQTMTLTAAVAVAEALNKRGCPVGIKWPNDILDAHGRKLCGIRCEMHCDMESVDYVIVGIGINVYQEKFPAEISAIATSMHQVSGETAPRAEIAAAVLDAFEENYQLLCAEGFAPIRAKWLEYNCCVGRRLTVTDERQAPQTGLCCGIDEQGYLLLETAAGVTRITGGDIIL
ncbi:MAG: biotin--[Firmicutes bacterium]|nr:biotin--[acetyl-CoA-carboxylase] ligase [Bacillota bacterium]